MKHQRIILFLLAFFCIFQLSAQKRTLKRGDDFYKTYSYSESIKKYEAITDKTIDIYRKLAESYYNVGKLNKAESYWKTVVENESRTADDIYSYASVLSMNKKYKESEKWMREFNKINANDTRGRLWANNSGFYERLQQDKGRFKIESLNINSKQSDFGTTYYKDKVVFASTRQPLKMIKREWNWNELPFLDIYIGEVDSSLHFTSFEKFHKNINKKFHEGPASFSADGKFMAFTRNNYEGKSKEGIIKLKLFTAEYKNDEWQKPVPLHFNSSEYSVGHASLTPNADTMYFASDMPGGFGGVDIYRIFRKADGGWTEPENLGDKINTEGNEMFPFVHPDGMLFYSSNGLLGLGGLDVFIAQITPTGFGKPENIGVPVNSSYDDFAFILDKQQRSGYFSSNRFEGEGDDDIYLFKLLKPFRFGKLLRGKTMDQDSNILANTKVNLYSEKGEVIGTTTTSEDGKYEWEIEQDKFYALDGKKEQYTDGHNTADSHTEDYIVYADLMLTKIPKFSLYFLVTDAKTGEALENVKVKSINYIENTSEDIITPKSGDFYRKLEGKKLNDSLSYEFVLEKEGYISETHQWQKVLYREGQYNVHEDLDFKLDLVEEGMDLGKIININPIYFDFNKSNIRPDAAIELDKIVKVMNDNPKMVIELGSHTDCRGSKRYNLSLSDRRAKSSAQYIKERITNPDRIFGKGYGESKLINHCECEGSRKVPCTEEEHQLNRRTEFTIIKK
jgi:outer membrane protein OmpA-like peptidoglycan-associated protein/tetratricopeptide (TPR) repeat protein